MKTRFPPKRHPKIKVAIPASLVSDVPHLREKTLKIGLVGRNLAIFRVDEVVIYPDYPAKNQKRDIELIQTILSYMETPQYIRKKLFSIRPELKFIGILPPLRTSHHPLRRKMKDLMTCEYREGVIIKKKRKGIWVDIGVETTVFIPHKNLPTNSRVTVVVNKKGKKIRAEIVKPEKISFYWGFKVIASPLPFVEMLKSHKFDLSVATSRHGKPLMTMINCLVKRWCEVERVLLAFGSPSQGLFELAKQEGANLRDIVDFIVNTVPNQGTKTIRTEEALHATLAALNLLTK